MTAANTEDTPRRKGDEIRAKIEANRRKRLNIAASRGQKHGAASSVTNENGRRRSSNGFASV